MDLNRSIKTIMLTGIFAVTILAIPITCLVEAASIDYIIENLRCPCGCNMVLEDCSCTTAKDMMNQIRQKIIDGKSEEQIIAEFHGIYGDIVLATPPKSGLELILWMLPIITSVMGTIVIYESTRGKESFPISEIRAPIAEANVKDDPEQIDAEMTKYEELFNQEYEKFKDEKSS